MGIFEILLFMKSITVGDIFSNFKELGSIQATSLASSPLFNIPFLIFPCKKTKSGRKRTDAPMNARVLPPGREGNEFNQDTDHGHLYEPEPGLATGNLSLLRIGQHNQVERTDRKLHPGPVGPGSGSVIYRRH